MLDSLPPDEVLIDAYAKAKLPSDRIALDHQARAQFCDSLPPEFRSADPEAIARRIVNLCKSRKLPRLS